MADFLLFEGPMGYSLFKVAHQADTVGNRLKEVQEATKDLGKFGKMVELTSFLPFENNKQALGEITAISEGNASETLISFLDLNLPKKKGKVVLGVSDKALASNIKGAFSFVECETGDTSEVVADMLRGIRFHASKLLKQLRPGDLDTAQLGLGHAYSRSKVKFSVQRDDNHIIQSISILDGLDKAINTFSMKVREWYSWHFPELYKIVSENHRYARLVLFIKDKKTLNDDKLHDLAALVQDDEGVARAIIDAAKHSMGLDISSTDMENVVDFAERVVKLVDYRKNLFGYLVSKMNVVAPNLAALIGDVVGARLISHAGSLTNLSKYPASTVQILGAEKALFRALKTKGNTPKYGLLYHSSFIGRAGTKNKGRISRFLANKCSIASRIDNFSEEPSTKFGNALRQQVEERLNFYATGAPPLKNADVMKSVIAELGDAAGDADNDVDMEDVDNKSAQKEDKSDKKEKKDKEKKEKKEKKKQEKGVKEEKEEKEEKEGKKDKKDKKEKKEKKEKRNSSVGEDAPTGTAAETPKKKRKHDSEDSSSKKKKTKA